MTKAGLVKRVVKVSNGLLNVGMAEYAVDAVLLGMKTGIMEDGNLILRNFGRFKVQHKNKRVGRNPKTGKPAIIPARKRVAFKASARLHHLVDKSKSKKQVN